MEQPQEQKQQAEEHKKFIIVTGFGPFVGHEKVNASWEAVKLLPDVLNYKETQYLLEKQMIPVEYAAVDKAVQEIWARQPELVIHCGVHGLATCIHVESLAYNHKFRRPDYVGKRLPKGSACLQNCNDPNDNDVIHCRLNIDKIVATVTETCGCTPSATTDATVAKASHDVGDYLCGYIYLKSLDMNNSRSLFVHVPPIDKPFNSMQTSDIVYKIVEECLRQIIEEMDECC